MNRRQLLWIAGLAVVTLAVVSTARVNVVCAQQGSEGGSGGAGYGGVGGGGGNGGHGGGGGNGYGGGGGGGGGGVYSGGGGGVAAYGEYVYVLEQETLYQFAAYDLTLLKKIDLKGAGGKNRMVPLGGGAAHGGGGQRGEGGGAGGEGGFGFTDGGGGSAEGVAAYGEYVYVLQGGMLRKLTADGLASVKQVTLDAARKAGN